MVFSKKENRFTFPLHYHEEFEINFIRNGMGAKRVIGDHEGEINDLELVLMGPNLPSGWFTNKCTSSVIEETTIPFHKDFIDKNLLERKQLSFIKNMLDTTSSGILFSEDTSRRLAGRITSLHLKDGFDSVLEFLSILQDLCNSRDMLTLSGTVPVNKFRNISADTRRKKVLQYVNNNFVKNNHT